MTAGVLAKPRNLMVPALRPLPYDPSYGRFQSARPPPSLLHRGANMQNQPATRHAKLSEGACAAENAESLKCIEKNYTDKGKCAAHFRVYKACKAKAYEAARAARIKAHSGG